MAAKIGMFVLPHGVIAAIEPWPRKDKSGNLTGVVDQKAILYFRGGAITIYGRDKFGPLATAPQDVEGEFRGHFVPGFEGDLQQVVTEFIPDAPPAATRPPAAKGGFARLNVLASLCVAVVALLAFVANVSAVPYKIANTGTLFDGRTVELHPEEPGASVILGRLDPTPPSSYSFEFFGVLGDVSFLNVTDQADGSQVFQWEGGSITGTSTDYTIGGELGSYLLPLAVETPEPGSVLTASLCGLLLLRRRRASSKSTFLATAPSGSSAGRPSVN